MNENEKKNKKTFEENIYLIKRFYPYLRKHLKTEVLVLCCVVVAAICEIMLPLIAKYR